MGEEVARDVRRESTETVETEEEVRECLRTDGEGRSVLPFDFSNGFCYFGFGVCHVLSIGFRVSGKTEEEGKGETGWTGL